MEFFPHIKVFYTFLFYILTESNSENFSVFGKLTIFVIGNVCYIALVFHNFEPLREALILYVVECST